MKTPNLFATPGAIERLGQSLFIKIPTFQSKKNYSPIYINDQFFNEIFDIKNILTWDEKAKIISTHFSLTIDKKNSTGKQTGWAYVDKQACPFGISLAGNLGSGRAYYVGKIFNIKGEKTPLAISKEEENANGVLNIEAGIWETCVANALDQSLGKELVSVLAILDMNENCEILYHKRLITCKRVKIIRVDKNGMLDRVTHFFHKKKSLPKSSLIRTAQSYGKLEGLKFIERIEHGMWSPGNISLEGHLIDFQTVCSVKGRSPQFSTTKWHIENYFGYEHIGQLKILKALSEDMSINTDHVKYELLKKTLLKSMSTSIVNGLSYLMGLENATEAVCRYKKEFLDLSKNFERLSKKFYFTYDGFHANHPLSLIAHLFDFSKFFRAYPLLKKNNPFDAKKSLTFFLNDLSLKTTYSCPPPDDLKYLTENIWQEFSSHSISLEENTEKYHNQILSFIKKYDALFNKIVSSFNINLYNLEMRAFIINEDRHYLHPVYTLSFYTGINKKNESNEYLNYTINRIILANQRLPSLTKNKNHIANLRLYTEGCSYLLLDGKGYFQIGIELIKNKLINIHNIMNSTVILFENLEYSCYVIDSGFFLTLITEKIETQWLLNDAFLSDNLNPLISIKYPNGNFQFTPIDRPN